MLATLTKYLLFIIYNLYIILCTLFYITVSHLPLIVGYGGINPAGRSSFSHGFKRIIYSALSKAEQSIIIKSLAKQMNLDVTNVTEQQVLDSSLIRQLNKDIINDFILHKETLLSPTKTCEFELDKQDLPCRIPDNWTILNQNQDKIQVQINKNVPLIQHVASTPQVQAAGQIPSGIILEKLYQQSHLHPRALQMSIYAASDALLSLGFDWQTIYSHVNPDKIGVYAGSAMGSLSKQGIAGFMQAAYKGVRPSSKQLAFSFTEMPGDFVSAYILGSVGTTGTMVGACASFLYNLKNATNDIRSGKCQFALVGSAEAPVTMETIEAYRSMTALAEDRQLAKLDNVSIPNYRRACRPFSSNCGFVISESAQFVVLMSEELALTLGAKIHGMVGDVFVNADGIKRSISAPGIGNYITLLRAAQATQTILDKKALQNNTFIHAHGTGTPQNRVTESDCLNEMAKAFSIDNIPVTAIKAYLGHSIGSAGADQLVGALGTWETGILPGIETIDHIADDVQSSNLAFLLKHKQVDPDFYKACLINSKGFGGNNATALILSPKEAYNFLYKRASTAQRVAYEKQLEQTKETAKQQEEENIQNDIQPIYRFGEATATTDDLNLNSNDITIPGFKHKIKFDYTSPYSDSESS